MPQVRCGTGGLDVVFCRVKGDRDLIDRDPNDGSLLERGNLINISLMVLALIAAFGLLIYNLQKTNINAKNK